MGAPSIYLSGSIKKGKSDSRSPEAFWTEDDEDLIRVILGPGTSLLNPAKTKIRRNDYFANYGCDLHLIAVCDVVLVDLRTEKGIGVGAELMFAQSIAKPVVGWIPRNTYYRRDLVEDVFGEDLEGWVHPFAFGLCDHLSDSLGEACAIVDRILRGVLPQKVVGKSPTLAMEHFLRLYPELPI